MKTIFKSFKFRIYPNKEQEILLAKHFGACRFIYNWALEQKIKSYENDKTNLSRFDLQSMVVHTLKKENE